MPGDTGLLDIHATDDVGHRLLAITQYLDDAESRLVREELKERNMHGSIYTPWCI